MWRVWESVEILGIRDCKMEQEEPLSERMDSRVCLCIVENIGGQNCQKIMLVAKILSDENFVLRKLCLPIFCLIK